MRPPVLANLLSLLVRVAAGTLVFVLVIAAVQSRDARISGMMLTFPALNGISLMMARGADPRAMARSMLAIIALNGIVGLAFIQAFSALQLILGPSARGYAWPLSGGAFMVWMLAFWVFSYGSSRTDRWIFRLFVVAAPLLAWLWWATCPLALGQGPEGSGATQLLETHAPRIALFALTLGMLLTASEWFGATNTLLGRLGAFPLLPLFSLATIAETRGLAGGAERLAIVKPTMLLGLLLAMAFAWGYSGFLVWLRERAHGAAWWAAALAVLVGGWIVCGLLIVGGMRIVSLLEGCT